MRMMILPWAIVATVFFGLLFVATIVGTVLFLAGRPRSGVRRVGGSLAFTCGPILVALVVLGLFFFGFATVRMQTREEFVRADQQAQQDPIDEVVRTEFIAPAGADVRVPNTDAGLKRLPDNTPPADALVPLTGHDDRTVAGDRPKWTNSSESKQGEVTHVVLASKQYATLDEARHELAATARGLLVQDFEKIYHTSAEGVRDLPVETLKSLAVRQEYVETVDRDFGSFFAPMHRVWWQLELSPVVRTELHPFWKSRVQERRTITVAGTLAAITLALGGLSLFTRRRPAVMGS